MSSTNSTSSHDVSDTLVAETTSRHQVSSDNLLLSNVAEASTSSSDFQTPLHVKYEINHHIYHIEPYTGDMTLAAMRQRTDGVVAYQSQLEAGLRFPLDPFICTFLHKTQAAIVDLHPNAFRILTSYIVICRALRHEPTISLFVHLFEGYTAVSQRDGVVEKRLSIKYKKPKILTPLPPKVHNWQSKPLFITSRIGWTHSGDLREIIPKVETKKALVSGDTRLKDRILKVLADAADTGLALFSWREILSSPSLLREFGFPDFTCPTDESRITIVHAVLYPGWEIHSKECFASECKPCQREGHCCNAMFDVLKFRSMSLSQRRAAFSNADGRRKRIAEARQAALSKTTEKEIPISIHGDDAAAIAREKANAVVEKDAGKAPETSHKHRKSKTPTREMRLHLTDEEEEVEKNQGQEQEPPATFAAPTIDPTEPHQSPNSRPHKRSRPIEGVSTEQTEEPAPTESTEPHVASWLQAGFQMPSDEDSLLALSREIGAVPDLPNINLRSSDQNYNMLGGGIIQRSSVPQRVREYEDMDEDYASNDAGFYLSGVSSVLYGMRNRCRALTTELESCEKALRRARTDKEKYKNRLVQREQDVTALQEAKTKLDEAIKGHEQAERELKSEMEAQKSGLEEQNKFLAAELEATKENDLKNQALIAQLKDDLIEAKAKAEMESMELYDKALIQGMRAAAASSSDIPAITPDLIAKWGSEPLYSDFSRKGHSLVAYEEDELEELAAEDHLLGKPVWEVPAVAERDALTLWADLINEKTTALREAKDAAQAALDAKAASSDNQDTCMATTSDNQDIPPL